MRMTDFSSVLIVFNSRNKERRIDRLVFLRAPRATFVLAISLGLYIYISTFKKKERKRSYKDENLHKILDVRIVLPNGKIKIADQSPILTKRRPLKKKKKKNLLTSRPQPSAPLSSRPRGCWVAAAVPRQARTVWWGWW